MTVTLDLTTVLPPGLGTEALDVTVLQDALLNLEQFQHQARTALFKKLAYHAQQGPGSAFEDALSELGQLSSQLTADTPEATLAQYAHAYRTIVEQEQQLVVTRATQQAEADLQAQLQEFRTLLQQGQLSEAAWCLVRLRRTVQEAQHAQRTSSSILGASPTAGDSPSAAHHSTAAGDAVLPALMAAARQYTPHCDACEQELSQVLDQGVQAGLFLEPAQGADAGPALHVRSSVVLHLPGQPQGLPVASREVWAALQAQGGLHRHVSALAELVLQQVLQPVLRGAASWQVSKRGAEGSAGGSVGGGREEEVVVALQPIPPSQQLQQHDSRRCEAVRQVLQALAATLLQHDEGLLRAVLGDALWGPLCDMYVAAYVEPAAAAAAAAAGVVRSAALHALLQEAGDLEEWAANLDLVEGACLKPAVAAAIGKLEAQQQVQPLEVARAALLRDAQGQADTCVVGSLLPVDVQLYQRLQSRQCPDWEAADPGCGLHLHTPLVALPSSPTPVSCRGRYRVGQGVQQVCGLVEQLLADAAAAGSQSAAAALVHCLAKLALLARCLPQADPTTRSQLARVLPLALLHHNGLLHLADALLTCSQVYGPLVEPLLGEPIGVLEPALLLRHEAAQVLQQQVAAQQAVFRELLEGGYQRFARLGRSQSAQDGIQSRKTTSQVLHSLGRLGKVLADHAAPEVHAQVATQILTGVCDYVTQHVMAKSDLGIDDCRELREVLGPLVQQALPALVPATSLNTHPAAAAAADDTAPHPHGMPADVLRGCIAAGCVALRRLEVLLELLDAGLRDLLAAWEKGRLQECGFSADQVVHLACALFEASEYRRDAIARIRASAW